MRQESLCEPTRQEISALLDGELTAGAAMRVREHLTACSSCAATANELACVRSLLRTQTAEDVPDLTAPIMARVAQSPRGRRLSVAQVALVAAVVAILLLAGSSVLTTNRRPVAARASEIAAALRDAARSLDAYRARFEIVERGWHERVPVRRFDAEVSFDAPDRFRLSVRDNSSYPDPSRWPANDIDLIVNPHRSWVREPYSCPTRSLPACATGATQERTMVARPPFDGAAGLPSDLIVPLETLSSSSRFEVVGTEEMLGHRVYHVALPYRQALPLVDALEQGGSWRGFAPFDRVDLWVDSRTGFPLRFEIRRGDSASGEVLLAARTISFSEPKRWAPGTFRAPVGGIVKSGGFEALPPDAFAAQGPTPSYTAGLRPYRAGVSVEGHRVLSYANGMAWLTVGVARPAPDPPAYPPTAEEVALAGAEVAYYEPASETTRRRVDLYGADAHVYLESNLPRDALLRVAASIPIQGRPLPDRVRRGVLEIVRLEPSRLRGVGFAELPTRLPEGYRPAAAFLVKGQRGHRSLNVYYRNPQAEYDGLGIRTTQSPSVRFLPPSFEEQDPVQLGGGPGRWSPARGEVEWMDHGIYRSVRAPSLGRRGVMRVARSLR